MSNPYEGDVPAPLKPPPSLCLKPYNFEIKDHDHMKNLLHCNMPIGTPVLKCPEYHVQLDHTIAVVWLFYSDSKNWNKLTTTHLEWAIRFIDGVVSLGTPADGVYRDVDVIKKHLEELLIMYYAEVDVETFTGDTGRITAMPVIEQIEMDSEDTKKLLENITITSEPRKESPKKMSKSDENLLKQLAHELAYIKRCRARIRKRMKSACKVNRLVQDVKSQAADIKRLTDKFTTIKNESSLFL